MSQIITDEEIFPSIDEEGDDRVLPKKMTHDDKLPSKEQDGDGQIPPPAIPDDEESPSGEEQGNGRVQPHLCMMITSSRQMNKKAMIEFHENK